MKEKESILKDQPNLSVADALLALADGRTCNSGSAFFAAKIVPEMYYCASRCIYTSYFYSAAKKPSKEFLFWWG